MDHVTETSGIAVPLRAGALPAVRNVYNGRHADRSMFS